MVEVRVFVIHSEKDNRILDKLFCEYHNRTFGNAKLQIRYVDSQKPSQLGRNFGDIIEEEIDNSKFVIVIITANSQQSVWVNQEIGYTWKAKKNNILPMKEKSMAEKGLGFIHSNIDAQLFHVRQQRFPKLDGFFENLGKKSEKVVKRPVSVKPIREIARVPIRESEPDVVRK